MIIEMVIPKHPEIIFQQGTIRRKAQGSNGFELPLIMQRLEGIKVQADKINPIKYQESTNKN